MPIVKSTNGEVAFALAIVKASVIADRQESSRIEAALQVMFPGVAVILVVEDDELATYQRRRELSDFSKRSACQVISSSRISAPRSGGYWPLCSFAYIKIPCPI